MKKVDVLKFLKDIPALLLTGVVIAFFAFSLLVQIAWSAWADVFGFHAISYSTSCGISISLLGFYLAVWGLKERE